MMKGNFRDDDDESRSCKDTCQKWILKGRLTMNNTEIKKIARNALKNEYGFAPALKDIVLLEAGEGRLSGWHINFRCGRHEYMIDGDVIEKLTGNEQAIRKDSIYWFNAYCREHNLRENIGG